jgi:seryl-tRNA synthetase
VEKENIGLKDEVKKLKEVKDQLVSRLHFTDIQVIEKTTEMQKIIKESEKIKTNNEKLQEYICLLQKSESGKVEYLKQQIKTLTQRVEVLTQQKKELAEAFNDFGSVFSSFSLKLS